MIPTVFPGDSCPAGFLSPPGKWTSLGGRYENLGCVRFWKSRNLLVVLPFFLITVVVTIYAFPVVWVAIDFQCERNPSPIGPLDADRSFFRDV